MFVSVAICTWNRAELLRQTLTQFRTLKIPPGVDWELLVVNNNCTDHTDSVVEEHAADLPIRLLRELKPGQSHARNCATMHAAGEYICWTDDDVLVDDKWLESYVKAFRLRPEAAFFGGPAEPWFEGSPPTWLRKGWKRIASAYAIRDLGPEPIRFTDTLVPYGVNYAVRNEEQRRFLYDSTLGLKPNSTTRGEETQMIGQMLATGLTGWWVPEARVRHFIPTNRQTLHYLRDYYRGHGESCVRIEEPTGPRWFGRPRWVWRQAIESEFKYHIHRVCSPPVVWLDHLARASVAWGMLRN